MKILFKIWLLITLLFSNSLIFAEEENISLDYPKSTKLWNEFKIDVTNIETELEEIYDTEIIIEWDTRWASSLSGPVYSRIFDSYWDKEIILSIYKSNDQERELIFSKEIWVFVYEKPLFMIIDSDINIQKIESFNTQAKLNGIYILNKVLEWNNLDKENIISMIKKADSLFAWEFSYISIWWGKDFLVNTLSKIDKEKNINNYSFSKEKDFALISTFNISILESYFGNFISWKDWIWDLIIIEDISKNQIFNAPESIIALENNLLTNSYKFLKVEKDTEQNSLLFISKFLNNLSNSGFPILDIYIIILIPFLLLWVSAFKHLIWTSTLGIIIPISLTIMFFKLWVLVSLWLLIVIILTNIIIARLINRYTLLYTPKISFITVINIVVLIWVINILYSYWLISLLITDVIFTIFFLIIAERMLSIIVWKEFREYGNNLIYTIVFSLLSYVFFSINTVQVIILSFPEMIIILIPLLFLIWRFTGLRITEYFRFKEIIKNIEEE